VILHSNGKWEFAPKKSKADADTLVFTRPVSATREWQSKKKFVITSLPTVNEIVKFAHQNKMNLKDLVFCGGEEYEIVFTVPPRDLNKVKRAAKKTNTPLFEIGHVANGKNVVLVDNSGTKVIRRCGWTHLRS